MTVFNIKAKRAALVNPRKAQEYVPISTPMRRQYRPGERLIEEQRIAEYRRTHTERLMYAKRCRSGYQFRQEGYADLGIV